MNDETVCFYYENIIFDDKLKKTATNITKIYMFHLTSTALHASSPYPKGKCRANAILPTIAKQGGKYPGGAGTLPGFFALAVGIAEGNV